MAKKTRVKKKRVRLAFDEGLLFVHSSFNNTIVSLADRAGNVLAWSSGGKIGYKGSRKSTPFAAQMAAAEVAKVGMELGKIRDASLQSERNEPQHPERRTKESYAGCYPMWFQIQAREGRFQTCRNYAYKSLCRDRHSPAFAMVQDTS